MPNWKFYIPHFLSLVPTERNQRIRCYKAILNTEREDGFEIKYVERLMEP